MAAANYERKARTDHLTVMLPSSVERNLENAAWSQQSYVEEASKALSNLPAEIPGKANQDVRHER